MRARDHKSGCRTPWRRSSAECFRRTWQGVTLQDSADNRLFRYAQSLRPRLLAWSRAITSRSAARSVGLVLMALSGLAMIGYLADLARLVQPLREFQPFRIGASVAFMMLGCGIFAASFARGRWIASICALSALTLGVLRFLSLDDRTPLTLLLSVAPRVDGVNWHGQGPALMAMSSAVYVVLGAIGLLAILSRLRGMWPSIALACCGGIVMLLASTVMVAQLIGVLDGVTTGPFIGSSLQASLGALVFSTYFNALVWSKEAGFSAPPSWLPLSVGAGSLITVLFVWRALIGSEQVRLGEQTRVSALSSRMAVTRQLMVAQRSLRRLARQGRAADSTWRAGVTQLAEDVQGVQSVIWADSLGRPITSDDKASSATLSLVRETLAPFAHYFQHEQQWASFIPIAGDPARALLVQPRCGQGRCTDLFVLVVDVRRVIVALEADSALGFELGVRNGDAWIYSTAPVTGRTPQHLVHHTIVRGGPNWQLAVWPSARLTETIPSSLSDLVLLLGIAVSVLLAIALRLAQTLAKSARVEERAMLDLALQTRTDGIWEWDLPRGTVTRSAQLWSQLGYGNGDTFQTMDSWMSLVHPQDRAMVESRLGDHLAGRAESYDVTYRVRSADGRWHDFVDRGRVVLRARDGTPLHLLGMFADVTDRRNAEEVVRQAETMSTMGRLAGRIAHEINNPLAGIKNSFMLIKDAVPETHQYYKYLAAIDREVQRIGDVTRQLYETYRPETESTSHAPVQTVVGDAVAFIEQVNRSSGVGVVVELGGIAAIVKLSDSMLRQCVYNLVQNAIEASPPGSRVVVHGAIEGDEFVLRVSDRGPGVPVELRERIFEPFMSTKPSKLSTGGMGMGLSLVSRAIRSAGGTIDVVDAEGGGAEFVARMPLVETFVQGVTA